MSRRRRIVCSIIGPEGGGKSRLPTTAPKPLLVLACDPNTEDVICKEFDVDTVDDLDPEVCRYVRIRYPLVGFDRNESDMKEEALDSWELMSDEIYDVAKEKAKVMPATVVLDSGTEINNLNMLKQWGRLDKISPNMRRSQMGAVNNDFKGLFRALEQAGVHVCVTHRVKDKWVTIPGSRHTEERDERVPGEYERIGFKEIGNICNTEVLMRFDVSREGKLSDKFGIRVIRSMARPAVIGEEWWGKAEVEGGPDEGTRVVAASFPFLGTLLYPGTALKDWE